MCGIFGGIGKPDANVIRLLAVCNRDRGKHSWGLFNGKKIIKKAGDPKEGLPDVPADFYSGATVLLGHTRYATHGGKTTENAHPFNMSGLVGAHNGVITNNDELQKKYNLKFDVDSQTILWMMANKGIDSLSEITGSCALWWWYKNKPDQIRLLRNSGNPLFWCRSDDTLYFSSDEEDLRCAVPWVESISLPEKEMYTISATRLLLLKREVPIGNAFVKRSTNYNINQHGMVTYRWESSEESPLNRATDLLSHWDNVPIALCPFCFNKKICLVSNMWSDDPEWCPKCHCQFEILPNTIDWRLYGTMCKCATSNCPTCNRAEVIDKIGVRFFTEADQKVT